MSMFWIEFIVDLDENLKNKTVDLHKEADELLAITVSSIKTLRKKSQIQKS